MTTPTQPQLPEEVKLRIVAAAVIHGGVIHTAPHHHLAMWQISCCWGEKAHGEQGFVASDGKFYGREESYQIAKAAGQIKFPLPYEHDDLFSEELWSYADWLKERKMGDSPDATPYLAPRQDAGITTERDVRNQAYVPQPAPVDAEWAKRAADDWFGPRFLASDEQRMALRNCILRHAPDQSAQLAAAREEVERVTGESTCHFMDIEAAIGKGRLLGGWRTVASEIATLRQERDELRGLLADARDTIQASTAETEVSDRILAYRRALLTRIRAKLGEGKP